MFFPSLTGESIFDRSLLIWIIAPVAPIAVALLVLGLVDSGQEIFVTYLPGEVALIPGKDADSDVKKAVRNLTFYQHYLTYLGISLFHMAACLTVVVMLVLRLWALPNDVRKRAGVVFLAILALLCVVGLAARTQGWDGGLNFAYRYICATLDTANLTAPIFPENGCFKPPLSRFALLALLPLITGVVAAALSAAVANTAFRPVTKNTEDLDAELAARSSMVETAFQATAFVLVTSVLTQVLFYRLPLPLILDETALGLMRGFAQSMTLFWGVVFTMTIIAMFGPGTLILRQHLRAHRQSYAGRDADDPDLPDALRPGTVRQQMVRILTSLAPLLIGASGSILEVIAGALQM